VTRPFPASPAVELRHVSKRFGDMHALRDISLDVRPGEVVAILGPNGAGKTTAISIMLGIRQPTSGVARIFGLEPRDIHGRSQCGVMLQDTGLPWNLRVGELVALFRTYYPAPLPMAEIMETAGIANLARVRAGDLSGGQRQRLAFALAICGNPSLLFLDEPTTGLDVDARHGFWREMKRRAGNGNSIVLTTHYMEEAEALADRIVIVHEGTIVADAPADALTSRVRGKHVRLIVPDGITVTAFAGLPVDRLEIAGTNVTFVTARPEEVLRALWQRGVTYEMQEIRGAALEDAVSALTHETEIDHAGIA